jgi:hypothetical protein
MNEGFPSGRCKSCGETFRIACPCGGQKRQKVVLDRIDVILSADLKTPGRSEAAARRLASRQVA